MQHVRRDRQDQVEMKSDFDIITRQFPNQDIKIYGFFDVHLGASEHLEKPFLDFRDSILRDPDAYCIMGGDLISNGLKNSLTNVYEETMRPREQKRLMTQILEPLAKENRILCLVSGNHERRSMKEADDDPTYDIACKLDIEDLYRPNMAFVKLQFGNNRSDGEHNPTYIIMAAHGAGGGSMTGGAVNRSEKFSYTVDGIDLIMVGHTHKAFVTAPAKIKVDPRQNRISFKPVKIVSMASWLAYGGYAAQKMLPPTSTAEQIPQLVILHGKEKWVEVRM
jgi:calcineurin-like phosphoesterase family protein